MNSLPAAAFLATELVRRQFRAGDPAAPAVPVPPERHPLRRIRVAIATGLARAADAVAPAGYHLAH